MTSYVSAEVSVIENFSLYIDGNSKITVGNGSYNEPVPNAFSLPHISTCPGATSECMSTCYVFGLQKNAPEVYKKYAMNERALHRILLSSGSIKKTGETLGKWITKNCPDGFRWHVSGDVMNNRHALWISTVANASPGVRHWIYTRTFNVVPTLLLADNLAVNISADADNYQAAYETATKFGTRMCYMTTDGTLPELREDDVIFPDYSLRGRDLNKPTEHSWWQGLSHAQRKMVCPPDFFGQSENHRCGPCTKCLNPRSAA